MLLSRFRLAAIPFGVALFFISLIGCGGGGTSTTTGSTTGTTSGGSTYTLKSGVVELDKTAAKVTSVAANSVVIAGAPSLTPGQILVHNAVDGTNFLRKVVSTTSAGGSTTVVTASAGLEDVFDTANILQSTPIPSTELAKLVPAQDGVTFAPSAKPGTRGNGGISIKFSKMLLKDDSNNPICQIDGTMNLDAGIETKLDKSFFYVNEFRAAPYVNASGTLTARGRIGGSFSKEFPISLGLRIPVTPFGPLGVNADVQLMMKVDGTYSAQGQFVLSAAVSAKQGISYTASGGWTTIQQFDHQFTITPPSLRASVEMDVSLVRPKIGVDITGIGEAHITADAVRAVGRISGQANPPGFVVEGLADFNFDVGGSIRLGPFTLWSATKSYSLGRFNIIQPYLLAALTPADTSIVYADLAFSSLHAMRGDGSNDHVIVSSTTQVFAPNVSNKGGRICFGKFNSAGRAELWICNPDGTGQQRLTDGTLSINHPSWSPNGDEIAFDASDSKGVKQIYVETVATGAIRQMTNDTLNSRIPAWSADASSIYFERATIYNTKVIAVTLSTSQTYDVILANDTTTYEEPSISANGLQLVCRRGGSEIVISDERGRGEHVILSNTHLARPTFSPDGLRVVGQYNDVSSIAIGSVDLDGNNPVPYAVGQQPSWGMSH